jgi:ferritin
MWQVVTRFIIHNWKYILTGINIVYQLYKHIKFKLLMDAHVKSLIGKLVEYIDKKTNTGIIDPIDQIVIKKLLEMLYHVIESEASPKIIEAIEKIAKVIDTGQDEEIIVYLTDLVNGKIDIPGIEEDQEAEIIKAMLQTIAYVIKTVLKK